jgi:hypothetical protein
MPNCCWANTVRNIADIVPGAEDPARFHVAAAILGRSSVGARQFRSGMIGSVGGDVLFQRSRGQAQSLSPRWHLHGFQVHIRQCLPAYEGLDLLCDFVQEIRLEPPFLASLGGG